MSKNSKRTKAINIIYKSAIDSLYENWRKNDGPNTTETKNIEYLVFSNVEGNPQSFIGDLSTVLAAQYPNLHLDYKIKYKKNNGKHKIIKRKTSTGTITSYKEPENIYIRILPNKIKT